MCPARKSRADHDDETIVLRTGPEREGDLPPGTMESLVTVVGRDRRRLSRIVDDGGVLMLTLIWFIGMLRTTPFGLRDMDGARYPLDLLSRLVTDVGVPILTSIWFIGTLALALIGLIFSDGARYALGLLGRPVDDVGVPSVTLISFIGIDFRREESGATMRVCAFDSSERC